MNCPNLYWLQFSVETDENNVEQIEDCFQEIEALAVTLQDAEDNPIFEPTLLTTPIWSNTIITALFEDATEDNLNLKKTALEKVLHERYDDDFCQKILSTLKIEKIKEENWVQKSQEQFKPMLFGKNLWVVPSFCEIPKSLQDKSHECFIVKLNPGLAFGTGLHASTALCLEWLANNPPQDKVVMDYGCGSGILALAALTLGAKKAKAVDIDPQAIESTTQNARLNKLEEKIEIGLPEQIYQVHSIKTQRVDLLLANILPEPILELLPIFTKLLKPLCPIVLSGILTHYAAKIIEALKDNFYDIQIETKEDWVRIVAKKNSE